MKRNFKDFLTVYFYKQTYKNMYTTVQMHNIEQQSGVCVYIYTQEYIKLQFGGGSKTTYLCSKQALHFSLQHGAQSLRKYHWVKKGQF